MRFWSFAPLLTVAAVIAGIAAAVTGPPPARDSSAVFELVAVLSPDVSAQLRAIHGADARLVEQQPDGWPAGVRSVIVDTAAGVVAVDIESPAAHGMVFDLLRTRPDVVRIGFDVPAEHLDAV